MIKVIKTNNLITIVGHANSNVYGKDIVCVSVSSIIYTTINAIKRIDKNAIDVIDNDIMKIKLLKDDEITNSLINNMIDLLRSLEKDYPKNIKVKEN